MFWFLIELLMAQPLMSLWEKVMSKNRLDDPVYKKNVRDLIERNRRFEEAKE